MKMETIEPEVNIGKNIRQIKDILGMSSSEVALRAGISGHTLNKLERQKTVDDKMLDKIAAAMQVPVELIKNYNHEDTIKYIISENTFNGTSESEGKGAVVQAGAMKDVSESIENIDNRITNDIDKYGELWQRIVDLEKKVIFYQMKYEGKDSIE